MPPNTPVDPATLITNTVAASQAVKQLEAVSSKAAQTNANLVDSAVKVGKAFAENALASSKASNEIGQFINKINSLRSNLGNLNTYGLIATTSTLLSFISGINNGTAALSRFSEMTSSGSKSLSGFMKSLSSIGGVTGKLGEVADNILNMSNMAKGFETSMLSAAMASGSFSNMFGDITQSVEGFGSNFDAVMMSVAKQSLNSANILGISYEDALQRTRDILSTLPNEFGKTYSVIDNLSPNINTQRIVTGMELLSQVARGTGKDFKTVMTTASHVSETFGASAQSAAERIAILSSAAQKMKMPFETINSTINGLDNSFAMWGDQMESAVKVLGQISTAMRDSNVGYKGQSEIMNSLSNAISGLTISQKAFLGLNNGLSSSGGAVGVGLKMEQMMQQGKFGEIAQMLQSTIEQKTGSPILSLDDAINSPEKQSTFMIQRGLLDSFGIKGEGTQNRLLEAMSKLRLGGGGDATVSAQQELENALNQGNDLTQRQTEYSAQVAKNTFDMLGHLNAMRAFQETREMFGGSIRDYRNQALNNNNSNVNSFTHQTVMNSKKTSLQDMQESVGASAMLRSEETAKKIKDSLKGKVSSFWITHLQEERAQLLNTGEKLSEEQQKRVKEIDSEISSLSANNSYTNPSLFSEAANRKNAQAPSLPPATAFDNARHSLQLRERGINSDLVRNQLSTPENINVQLSPRNTQQSENGNAKIKFEPLELNINLISNGKTVERITTSMLAMGNAMKQVAGANT